MFTARENAKVALGCKYKKEKNQNRMIFLLTQQENCLRGRQKYANVIGC